MTASRLYKHTNPSRNFGYWVRDPIPRYLKPLLRLCETMSRLKPLAAGVCIWVHWVIRCEFIGYLKEVLVFFILVDILWHVAALFNGPLSLRLIGGVGARSYVRSSFSQWVFSKS